MLFWRLTRRVAIAAAIFAVLATALVESHSPARAPVADTSPQPAVLDEHTVPAASDDPGGSTPAREVVAELPRTTVDGFGLLGVTWDPMKDSSDLDVTVQWRHDGSWSSWTELHLDLENTATEGGRPGTEPQWVGDADGVAVRVTSAAGVKPQGLKVATIDPGRSSTLRPVAASVGQPRIISRSQWGAKSTGSCDSPKYGATTQGAVIHHTAGSNTYSASQSAGIVKATQAYHMGSRRWCDIGYNFLVDKYGQIFEGRAGGITRPVRAAHSGNDMVNQQTMGVSLMGTFTSTEPSSAMKSAVVDLVAWRFAQYKRSATGTYRLGGKTLNRIAGHRNVVSTECPGAKAYAWLGAKGGLRARVADRLAAGSTTPEPPETLPSGVTRLGGDDRYATAVEISKKSHPAGSDVVFVANGTGFADGLAAGPGAGKLKAPLLLTEAGSIPSTTLSEIKRLKPSRIYVVGGAQVVSDSVVKSLAGLGGVTRLAGQNRWSTAADVATTLWSGAGTVYIASGMAFPDALSGGGAAAKAGSPLLLSETDFLSAATRTALTALRPSKVVIVGGPAALTERVVAGIKDTIPGASITRYGGQDRFQTAAKLMDAQWDGPISTVFIASGMDFPDALAGVPASKTSGAAFALAPKTCVPYDVNAVIGSSKPTYVMLGGRGVLSTTATQKVCAKRKPPAATSASSDQVTVPANGQIVVSGHGYGHGIGMSQYGAEGAARTGKSYSQILSHYYPGTSLSTKSGDIRVLVSADTTDGVLIKAQSGLKLQDLSGKRTISLPTSIGGKAVDRWEIVRTEQSATKSKLIYRTTGSYTNYLYKGSALLWSGDGQFTGPSTISLILPNGSIMKVRGDLRSAKPSSGSSARNTVNILSIDDYTRGVIAAEMPSSWHSEALKSQAVAARTYGARSINSSRYYDICSTTACQVYGGASRETSSTNSAVTATAGKILTYRGATALTQFSSSSGGYTSQGSQPYLKAVSDPWDGWSGNKNHDWKITVPASKIQKAYSSIGTLKSMQVTDRNGRGDMGGRVSKLKLVGTKGTKTITGNDARWAFGLKSNWFAF